MAGFYNCNQCRQFTCWCTERSVGYAPPPPPQHAPKFATFMQAGHTLTDADVERVARRVVEMLAEKLK